MELKFQIQTKVNKPVEQVFDAVYNPEKIKRYFATAGASGPLKEGTTVMWAFQDDGCEKIEVPVVVEKVIPNKLIRLKWDASDGEYDAKAGKYPEVVGYKNLVEMTFEELGKNQTLVKISEGSWRETPQGLKASYQNCQGWTEMACFLKAYLEYDINLRQ